MHQWYLMFLTLRLPFPTDVKPKPKADEARPEKPHLKSAELVPTEGMLSLADYLEWDVVAFLTIFVSVCYVILFLLF